MTQIGTAMSAEMQEALGAIERIGGAALVRKICTMFEQTARERLLKFGALIEAGDTRQISRLGHAMKGSAAQVGAEPLRTMAESLEKDAAGLDADEHRRRVDALHDEAERVFAQLQGHCATLGA